MKLERIVLNEFRRFRTPLVLDHLQPGLNLFVGPNEAGKSTVAAALRAAFLERYKTRTVVDLAPWGLANAQPSVELDFIVGERRYRLRKTFLNRARCELSIEGGAERLEGEAAEEMLAQLLGFGFAAKGQSRDEHGGIPGLLWVRQGEGQNLMNPAEHAGAHLREALTRLSGELTSNDSDRVYDRVARERAALLDPRAKPKGEYRVAEEALELARSQWTQLHAARASFEADVDRLAELRRAHELALVELPWREFETRAEAARARLAAIEAEHEALEAMRRELQQTRTMAALLEEQAGRDREDEAQLRRLEARCLSMARGVEDLRAAHAAAQARAEPARELARVAELALQRAQTLAARQDLEEQVLAQERERDRLERALAAALGLAQGARDCEVQLLAARIEEADLLALRQSEQTLQRLLAEQKAVATRLSYQLEAGAPARLDGVDISGSGEVLLTHGAELYAPGVGRFRIEPGGSDLPTLLADLDARRGERERLLHRLDLNSLAEAEQRATQARRLADDLKNARRELAIYAPDGIDRLQAACEEARRRHARLLERRASADAQQSPRAARAQEQAPAQEQDPEPLEASDKAVAPDVSNASAHWRSAEANARQALLAVQTAASALEAETARLQLLQAECAALQAEHAHEARVQQRQERAQRLLGMRGQEALSSRRLAEAEQALAAHQPQLLRQDLERFERSARAVRDEHQSRHEAILQLQGRLEQAGTRGLDEQYSALEADLERLTRRRDEFAQRAAALDLLHGLLREKRDAATQRLQAPLARRLNHYLSLVFANAALRLDDTLRPVGLLRGDNEDALAGLSFGTQEQLGILVRMAYADLLREAGRPTLLVLDDALVHSDDGRREFLKRAIFDAASRHQILMFTCHGDAWRDLGVEQRRLGEG